MQVLLFEVLLKNFAEFLKSNYSVEIPSYLLDFAMKDQAGFTQELSTFVCLVPACCIIK